MTTMTHDSGYSERFNRWLDAVDREIVKRCGMGLNDLPDCCYADWFEDGISPRQAAYDAVNSAMSDI